MGFGGWGLEFAVEGCLGLQGLNSWLGKIMSRAPTRLTKTSSLTFCSASQAEPRGTAIVEGGRCLHHRRRPPLAAPLRFHSIPLSHLIPFHVFAPRHIHHQSESPRLDSWPPCASDRSRISRSRPANLTHNRRIHPSRLNFCRIFDLESPLATRNPVSQKDYLRAADRVAQPF